jgi:hypothetical protein
MKRIKHPFIGSGGPIDHLIKKNGWSEATVGRLACWFIANRTESTQLMIFMERLKESGGDPDARVNPDDMPRR